MDVFDIFLRLYLGLARSWLALSGLIEYKLQHSVSPSYQNAQRIPHSFALQLDQEIITYHAFGHCVSFRPYMNYVSVEMLNHFLRYTYHLTK